MLVARVGVVGVLAAGALALAAPGPAQAAGVTNFTFSGTYNEVSCLTATRCVATGVSGTGVGIETVLNNGVRGQVSTIATSILLAAPSCPSSAGCWDVGWTATGAPLLIKIGSSGLVSKTMRVSAPAKTTLTAISCTSMTACVVAGYSEATTPWAIVTGFWNGSKLRVYRVVGLKAYPKTTITALSCHATSCEVVGYATTSSGYQQTAITLHSSSGGKPGKLRTLAVGTALYGVSCVSTLRCYAVGAVVKGDAVLAIVTTVANSVASSPTTEAGELFGITCAGSACTAAGGIAQNDLVHGVLYTISSGTVTGSQTEDAVTGYNDIAAYGTGGFAAIGMAVVNTRSVLTVGAY